MTVLMGPADADHFRVKVGRYGDRWYTDPLPSCPIAEASDWTGPAISIVKKAASNDWSYVTMARCARDIVTNPNKYKGETLAVYEQLKVANKVGLDVDTGRGNIIHLWCEDLLHGRPMRDFTEWDLAARKLSPEALTIALAYKPAIQHFFDVYQPELFAAEFVSIDRILHAVGYGGTGDCILRIGRKLYIVDWKSRGPSSDHGAYPDEAGQVAALVAGQYMIVTGPDGEAKRIHVPDVDAGLIVSIKPEGCRTYPIDLDRAADHWTAMHAWWVARRNEREPIGRAWPARNSSAEPDTREASGLTATATAGRSSDKASAEERRQTLLARYQAMSQPEQLAFCDLHIDPNDLDAVETGLDSVDKFNITVEALIEPTWGQTVNTVLTTPDEGDTVTDADIKALHVRFDRLNLDAQLWLGTIVAEGKRHHDFRIKDRPTERRYHIYRALLTLAEHGSDWANDDTLTDLLDGIAPIQTDTPGGMLSHLDHHQAAEFARRVDFYTVPQTTA